MNATIEIDGLRKRLRPAQALDGMTFTGQPGHMTGFVVPNGAGKTTTVRMLLWLARLDTGAIRSRPSCRTSQSDAARRQAGEAVRADHN